MLVLAIEGRYVIMCSVKTRIEMSFSYSISYSNSNLKSLTDLMASSSTDSCKCALEEKSLQIILTPRISTGQKQKENVVDDFTFD